MVKHQRNTVPISVSITKPADSRLLNLATLQKTSKSEVVNNLLLAAPDTVPQYVLNVVSTEPLVITGEPWEGRFDGVIGIKFPMNPDDPAFNPLISYIRINTTFEDVIARLQ